MSVTAQMLTDVAAVAGAGTADRERHRVPLDVPLDDDSAMEPGV
jgi:hypothetical protein